MSTRGPAQLAWRWVWLTLAVSVGAGVALTVLLWGHTTTEHRDAFDVGWRAAAAVLAVFATFLGVSRVRLSQREHDRQLVADRASRQDATARQITELATKASEQLGAANAATRIGGLAALERLAQTHPELRQTVVDQICSYLRRPFRPPPTRARTLTAALAEPGEPQPDENDRDGTDLDDRLESDVRRGAQEILRRHLVWPSPVQEPPDTFWADMAVDLRDAVLVDLDLGYCRAYVVDVADADLHGTTTFTEFACTSVARFDGTRFGGRAQFGGAVFHQRAEFTGAVFGGDASFHAATFHRAASFEKATFAKRAGFGGGQYFLGGGCAYHGGVKIEENGATFAGSATFQGATFHDVADFQQTVFTGPVHFQQATFADLADFHRATFVHDSTSAVTTWPPGGEPVTVDLAYTLMFRDTRVRRPERSHTWPPGWRFLSGRDGDTYLLYVPGV